MTIKRRDRALHKTDLSRRDRALHKTAGVSRRQIVEVAHMGDLGGAGVGAGMVGRYAVTYQLELVDCGKPKCKKMHGPYWYAYWRTAGRDSFSPTKMRSLYIGKKLRSAASVLKEKGK